MNWTDEQLAQAKLTKQYFPYRRIWLAMVDGEFMVIAKPTAAYANNLARKGAIVAEMVTR